MISVLRQLPRNTSTMAAVSAAASSASNTTPLTAALTNTDWSNSGVTLMSVGMVCTATGSMARRLFTMSMVEAPPFLRMDNSTPRTPSWRTMLVCGEKPSRTCATSRKYVVAPLIVRTGRSLSPSITLGELFIATLYSIAPILAVPEGRIKFCEFTALTTSLGARPRACSAGMSRSTEISRVLPP